MGRRWVARGLAASIVLAAPMGHAQAPGDAPPEEDGGEDDVEAAPTASELPDADLAPGEYRPVPAYDGRLGVPASPGRAALWVPRILLSPIHFVAESLVRRPIAAVATTVQEHEVAAHLFALLRFGPQGEGLILPTFLVDFGMRTSGGLALRYDEPSGRSSLRARVAYGGSRWWLASAASRVNVHDGGRLDARVRFDMQPDYRFHGIGPRSGDFTTRYRQTRLDATLGYRLQPWRASRLDFDVGVRHVAVDGSRSSLDDTPLNEAVAAGVLPSPAGLGAAYGVVFQRLDLALDSRWPRPAVRPLTAEGYTPRNGSGVRVAGRVEHATSIQSADPATGIERPAWIRYGGTLGGYVDVTGTRRVVGLTLVGDLVDPMPYAVGELPFTELVTLGGSRPLRGLRSARLMGRSALAATLDYRWPIWTVLDGRVHYGMGTVFGEHFDGFDAGLLRASFGLGVTSGGPDRPFEILFALPTDPIEDGMGIDGFRFVFGTTEGF